MQCSFCGAAYEGPYCPVCGRGAGGNVVAAAVVPAFVCARCGVPFFGPACPACGTPVGGPMASTEASALTGIRATGSVFWTFGMISYLALLVANLVAFAYTANLIVQGALAGGPRYIDLYVLAPFAVGETYDVSAEVFLAYFLLIVIGIVLSYVWFGVRDGRATARTFTRPLADFRSRMESRSAWVATGQVFLASLFFQFAFILLLAAAGFEPETPGFVVPVPDWYQYFALANASVYEEFVARWLFIGVPLAL
ncbi:MAG: hypothetical protein AABY30_04795, partial [Candidatus Thermoplasmatota archaeon]